MLIPGEEGNVFLGGHWNLIFPRPVYWFWDRLEGQEFRDRRAPYGDVFHLGNAEDTHRLITEQSGLMWQAHPRSKGSVGYPDKIVDQAYYKDARWIGASFKDMPSDLSSPRLGDRALDLLDDMNNWGGRRFLVGRDRHLQDRSDARALRAHEHQLPADGQAARLSGLEQRPRRAEPAATSSSRPARC